MHKFRFIAIPLLIVALFFSMVQTTHAQPLLPSSFYGEIHFLDGAPSAGDYVEAYVPGVSTYVAHAMITDSSGTLVYDINVPGDDDLTVDKDGGLAGDVVTFKIASTGRVVGTGTWTKGSNVQLDFHPPYVTDIPDQTIAEGASFTTIALDNYVSDWVTADANMIWTYSGNSALSVSIIDRVATISMPNVDWNGSETITFKAADPGTAWDEEAATFTVTAVNDAPVAVDDTNTTAEDTALLITASTLKTNDTDVDNLNSELSVSAVSNSVNGTVSLESGTITFTPTLDFVGTAGFDYTVGDLALTDTGHVTITVTAVNDTPVAVDDTNTTAEDTALLITAGTLKTNDTDVDNLNTELSVNAVSNPVNGTVDLVSGTITFTPTLNFVGTAGFDYNVYDGALTDTGHVTITVTAVNDTPTTTGISDVTVVVNAADTSIDLYDAFADVEDADASLIFTVESNSNTALFTSVSVVGQNLVLNYATDAFGTANITVRATDTGTPGLYVEDTFTVTVNEVTYTISGNAGVAGATISYSIGGTPLTVTADASGNYLFSVPSGWTGTVTASKAGYTFTPAPASYTNVLADQSGANFTASGTCSISLITGWNLVSCNLQPANTAIKTVLTSLIPDPANYSTWHFDIVYAWNATVTSPDPNWMKFDNVEQSLDSLTSLNETQGFWIHMLQNDTLVVAGTVPTTTNISLAKTSGGWNLVGYPSAVNRLLPGVFSDHGVNSGATPDFTLVYAFHASDTADQWKLFDATTSWVFDLTELSPGWGYWIYVNALHTWDVKYLAP
jgi:hypothetical protein